MPAIAQAAMSSNLCDSVVSWSELVVLKRIPSCKIQSMGKVVGKVYVETETPVGQLLSYKSYPLWNGC